MDFRHGSCGAFDVGFLGGRFALAFSDGRQTTAEPCFSPSTNTARVPITARSHLARLGMATLGEEDASFDAPLTCANNPNASAMGAAEWAACAGSSGEAYAPFITIIEAQVLRTARRWHELRPPAGCSRRQLMPEAAVGLGQPRQASRFGRAGLPMSGLFLARRATA